VDDRVGGAAVTGPVAFAALPFDRGRDATFIVPSRLHGSTPEGRYWTTTIDAEVPSAAPSSGGDPDRIRVRAVRTADEWCAAVAQATERIVAGHLRKVVLAREIEITAATPFDPVAIAARLAAAHPDSLRFSVDGFVGASPELLVSRFGDVVRAQPMAGTTVRTGDTTADSRRAAELLASEKNRQEHQITIDMAHDTLLPWCSYLDAEPTPSVVPAGPVQHLATLVEGRLSHPAPSVLELVAALHPTPAVGGWPTEAALGLIRDLESADRGRYAGPVGWVDAHGNGAWAVGIRSAEVDGRTARVFAGVGVVADSEPLAELEETRAKLAATLASIIRP
jgi:menaquinone-specific isochorismate synthase